MVRKQSVFIVYISVQFLENFGEQHVTEVQSNIQGVWTFSVLRYKFVYTWVSNVSVVEQDIDKFLARIPGASDICWGEREPDWNNHWSGMKHENLCLWRYSKLNWMMFWAVWSNFAASPAFSGRSDWRSPEVLSVQGYSMNLCWNYLFML